MMLVDAILNVIFKVIKFIKVKNAVFTSLLFTSNLYLQHSWYTKYIEAFLKSK